MVLACRAFLLSLLLLFVQQESLVHQLQHDRARLADAKQAWQVPAEGTCVTCALLAGGTHTVATEAALPVVFAPALAVPTWVAHWRAAAVPSYYSSRAPPTLL